MATPAAGSALLTLVSTLTKAAAVRSLERPCVGAGFTCVAVGHPARPWGALEVPCLSLVVHVHIPASASAFLTSTLPV